MQMQNNILITLKETCSLLAISTATGRNWIKSGRLIPTVLEHNRPFFDRTYIANIKKQLSDGTFSALKSRRNKKYVAGTFIAPGYVDKESPNQSVMLSLFHKLNEEGFELTDELLLYTLRFFAAQLLFQSKTGVQQQLLNTLLADEEYKTYSTTYSFLEEFHCTYVPKEDTLGFFYLSLKNLADRKSSGSYYTPAWLAKKLIAEQITDFSGAASILDPSCGTGCFLLQLPSLLPLETIHGYDIDPISIAITRINLAIKYRITEKKQLDLLCKNIVTGDFLSPLTDAKTYDLILGNPPWGAGICSSDRAGYSTFLSCANTASPEIYDLFIEKSLQQLKPEGKLSFVLPEALLTVKAHAQIRSIIQEKTHLCSVEYLGEAFEQVHCPSILLTLQIDQHSFYKNAVIKSCRPIYSIGVERIFSKDFPLLLMPDEEYLVLQSILSCSSCTTLVDQSVFALGLVTGNNAFHIKKFPGPELEPIIKGSDITKYHISSPSGYICFSPEQLQQTAPECCYRAPEKLVYRFINKQLVFAYDNTGLLTLNSCNILIPQIDGLAVKYVMSILNSSVAQFVFERCFRSVKVLRSHLEQIPIPVVGKEMQNEVISYTDQLMMLDEDDPQYNVIYQKLDIKIAELYQLSKEDYRIITG